MKCMAEKIYAQKQITEAYHDLGELFIRFLDVSTGYVLHTHPKLLFGQKRLYKYYEQSAKGLTQTLNFYAADGDGDREAVDISLFVYEKRLKEIGVDLKEIDAEILKEFDGKLVGASWSKAARKKTRSRSEFLKTVDLPSKTYHAAALWYLHEEYGLSIGRLPEIYRIFRRLYYSFCELYINGTVYGDEACRKTIQYYTKELEKIGILFHEINFIKNKGV